MLAEAAEMAEPDRHTVSALVELLSGGDAVLRTASALALGALASPAAAGALAGALLDEEPDVRADAMTALALCATGDERDAVMRSLRGDPVPEVKVAAVRTLGRSGGAGAVDLLIRLATSRAEDEIDWDDTDSVWDDWLDVQVAAIEALGRLGATGAIPALLEARQDEFGQDLDLPVFSALAAMGPGGLSQLMVFLQDPSYRVRRRALGALGGAAPGALAEFAETLAQDPSADVRRIAGTALPPNSPRIDPLMLHDDASEVRAAAVRQHGAARADLIVRTLADPAPEVVAEVLSLLLQRRVPVAILELAENLAGWTKTALGALADLSMRLLSRVAPDHAGPILVDIAFDPQRLQTDRITAIGLIPAAHTHDRQTLAPLPSLLESRERQIRLASLAALVEIAGDAGPETATAAAALLAKTIDGAMNITPADEIGQARGTDLATPKGEPEGASRIVITRDGEIQEDEQAEAPNVVAVDFPRSTLDAVQQRPTPLPETPTEVGPRRRRVSTDGPDDIGLDLRVAALNVVGDVPGEVLDATIARASADPSEAIQLPAIRATGRRSVAFARAMLPVLAAALRDNDPAIRHAAAEAISVTPEGAEILGEFEADDDANVRACVVGALAQHAPDTARRALRDQSSYVRRCAAKALLMDGHAHLRDIAIALFRTGDAETFRSLSVDDPDAAGTLSEIICQRPDDREVLLGAVWTLQARSTRQN